MRQIVLDTETTGLESSQGHRIIEIGCVEIINRRITDNRYQQYLNPGREIDEGAMDVHGITNEFLVDKPLFADCVDDFVNFISGTQLIIHNAPFDVGFINHELGRLNEGRGTLDTFCTVQDTLVMARRLHPGQKNSLDDLCRRYNIDNSQRELHGALLDAEILAEVYLAMTEGQVKLSLEDELDHGEMRQRPLKRIHSDRPRLPVIKADGEELAAHENRLQAIDETSEGQCVWRQLETSDKP